ncbi:60S ribosomal protein L7a, putative [Eimeria acervulina]|uniref:60S ribosomal protein L7a, putative n=1 Tax=Eimeria acervulina TaxID=5801 RepID=U6GHT8_EIMAC|nr:60S ribosomal protein L7a, putative [Eimeria acervulina]CDI78853.1 60S ribosomal protein L7a, putative [Eimeria acervulina]
MAGEMETDGSTAAGAATGAAAAAYVSPCAVPLLEGKAFRRALRLIKGVAATERLSRARSKGENKEGEKDKSRDQKAEQERKGRRPLKLLQRGVHEVTKAIRYAFGSKRPASVIMLAPPPSGAVHTPQDTQEETTEDLEEMYNKLEKIIRKNHPYM